MFGKILILIGFGGVTIFECISFTRSIIKFVKSRKQKPPNIEKVDK